MDVASLRDVLVISGPCGAGKTSVGFECLELLEAGGVAAAMIDAELTYFHPKPVDDPKAHASPNRRSRLSRRSTLPPASSGSCYRG